MASLSFQSQSQDTLAEIFQSAQHHTTQRHFSRAIVDWRNAAQHCQLERKHASAAFAWFNLASIYDETGDTAQLIQSAEKAMQQAQLSHNNELIYTVGGKLGASYLQSGQLDKAGEQLSEALKLALEAKDKHITAALYNDLGNLHQMREDWEQAQSFFGKSITLASEQQLTQLRYRAEINMAYVAAHVKNMPKALTLIRSVLQYYTSQPASEESVVGILRAARVWQKLGTTEQKDEVNTALIAAVNHAKKLDDKPLYAQALAKLGEFEFNNNRYNEALDYLRQAIFIGQSNHVNAAYQTQWHWLSGKIFNALEDQHAALSAYRQAVWASKRSGNTVSTTQLYFEYANLLFKIDTSSTTNDNTRLIEAREAIEELRIAELKNYFQDACVSEAQRTVKIDNVLGSGEALFYSILFDDRAELLLTLPSGAIQRYTVPITKAAISTEVQHLLKALERRKTRSYLEHAQQLYHWLIEPLEQDFSKQGIHTLITVPDFTLRALPFSSLHDGQQFLIEKTAIATIPSIQLIDPQPLNREHMNILLGGITQAVHNLTPLKFVLNELNGIDDIFGNSTMLIDQHFTSAQVNRTLSKQNYTITHIASHGYFSGRLSDSYIAMHDTKLSMNTFAQYIGQNRLSKQPIELLTLSACQTASGNQRAALGLAGITIQAGARSALATLWPINDKATSSLMNAFYVNLKTTKMSKAKALQQAQLTLLDELDFRHPGFWSSFLLIGNWL